MLNMKTRKEIATLLPGGTFEDVADNLADDVE